MSENDLLASSNAAICQCQCMMHCKSNMSLYSRWLLQAAVEQHLELTCTMGLYINGLAQHANTSLVERGIESEQLFSISSLLSPKVSQSKPEESKSNWIFLYFMHHLQIIQNIKYIVLCKT